MIALGERLAARGHDVWLETWRWWRKEVEDAGMRFVAAPEYPVFPTRERQLQPYKAVVRAATATRRTIAELAPDVVVHDILTLGPALAGELEEVALATLIPHVYPYPPMGFPPYALGARMPRTRAGWTLWGALARPVQEGLRRGRAELNEARVSLGLPPVTRLHGGLSERLCIVGTFPALEYPRRWPNGVHVVGPLMWEPPYDPVSPPPGDDSLVLVAPSTAHDPEQRLLRSALAGLAGERLRVLASTNRRPPPVPVSVPPNARLVEWLSYSQTMPGCDLVISHVGHGTMARALACGCPVVAVPHSGDMAENAARADWAGVGVRLPWRLLSPLTLRAAVRRALEKPGLTARARELEGWAAARDGTSRAAELVEELALEVRPGARSWG